MKPNREAERAFGTARAELLWHHPFWGMLLFGLEPVQTDDIPTEATDGEKLWYNPDFLLSIPAEQRLFELAHEIGHCMFEHHLRRGDRDPDLWNAAGDILINNMSVRSGFAVPGDALVDSNYDGPAWHTEAIYNDLKRKDDAHKPHKGEHGGCGGIKEPTRTGPDGMPRPLTTAEKQTAAAAFAQKVASAALIAKQAGRLPADVERFVEAVINPKQDWRELTRRFVDNASLGDYSWARPSTRYMVATGAYLPSIKSRNLGTLVVVFDVSGSIDAGKYRRFAEELSGAVEQIEYDRVIVIFCDAKVRQVDEYVPGELPIKVKSLGGGGTSFAPPVEYLEREGITPSVMIYATDLCGRFPPEPDFPVLWAVTGPKDRAPFGEVVNID